ncbi:MAG: hypothetical protein AAF491_00885 [Verrucomicrobiota bacterium]
MMSQFADSIFLACPMCVGTTDGVLGDAANSAIAVMLVLLCGVLMGFLGFIFYLMKRAKTHTGDIPGDIPGEMPA